MAPLNPLPVNLQKECSKCAAIFSSFARPERGLDGVVPASVLRSAKGFAIFQVVKMGFLFSARAGTGVVLARLPDGSWSAPSAIGTGGAGFGAQAGAEITDFLIILNSRAAVRSFQSSGSLQLGGNLSIAVGPMGRNTEGSAGLNTKGTVATMYSYSKTRGLFGGVSVEGSVIVERSDANRIAYGANVTASQLLSGNIEVPKFAHHLIETIERCVGEDTSVNGGWINDKPMSNEWKEGYAFGEGVGAGGVGRKLPRRGSAADKTTFENQFSREDDDDPWLAQERQKEKDQMKISMASNRNRSKSNPNPQRSNTFSRSDEEEEDSIKNKNNPFKNDFSDTLDFNRGDYTDSSGDEEHFKGGRQSRSRPTMSRNSTGNSVGSWKGTKKKGSRNFLRKGLSWRSSTKDLKSQISWHDGPEYRHEWKNNPGSNTYDDEEVDEMFREGPTKKEEIRPKTPLTYTKGLSEQEKDLMSFGPSGSYFSPSTHLKGQEIEEEKFKDTQQDETDYFDFDRFKSNLPGSKSNPTKSSTVPIPSAASALPPSLPKRASAHVPKTVAIALFDFAGVENGDLSFKKGDVINVVEKGDDEWWTGTVEGRIGIFPKNYTKIEEI